MLAQLVALRHRVAELQSDAGSPASKAALRGDRDKLAHGLANLASNAIKHSPDGGDVAVSAKVRRKERQILLSVSDQAAGITQEDQDRLFATFELSYRPETVDVHGPGLGLYTVKGLAELMGGTVWRTAM